MRYKSPLATYVNETTNTYGYRPGSVDGIALHHCAGVMSAKQIVDLFTNTGRSASCTYGVGVDGDCACGLPEYYTPWTTSSYALDSHVITIEVSNSATGGDWPVSDASIATVIDLCTDICRYYGFRMNYTGDKSGNLHKHQWYAPTACPGPYLGNMFDYIANEVNKRLDESKEFEGDEMQHINNEGGDTYRLYNEYNGDHHFTLDNNEKNDLVKLGWKYEGVAWKAPRGGIHPVYRMYNPGNGDHLLTIGYDEAREQQELGWKWEGVPFFSNDSGTPVYRVYNPNAGLHHFTADKGEYDKLVSIGYKAEDVAFYV